jgi:crotonobetaine/carnitine-CoA ligase
MPVPEPSDPINPFEAMDIRSLIDARAADRADHPFLIWEPFAGEGGCWTYGEFADAVSRFAAGLIARGTGPGTRLLIHLDNSPEFLVAWLGAAYAGAVPVTTNTNSAADELAYFAQHSRAQGAITQPRLAGLVDAALPASAWRVATDTDQGQPAEFPQGFGRFAEIDDDPARLPDRPHDPRAPFGIQYTSGTTARPKAVVWTHANALWGARLCALHEDLRPDDVHLTYLPLFHTNAQVYSVLASLWAGASVVLQPRFSASRFWPVSLRHRATWTSMVPFCTRALAGQPVPPDHSYRFFGNAVCDAPWDALFGIRSIGWWGMTETIAHGSVGSVHGRDAPLSMGRPSPGYRLHVRDEQGKPVGPGGVGDLFVEGVRGVSLFLEYADNPEATAAAFTPDGLFITGDRVRVGEDGWLYFADRSKDMLKVGGENVAASEIERVIAQVAGVREVAVVAMPHAMLDEVPAAFVVPDGAAGPDLEARILAACARSLAGFKQPRLVRCVDDLPRSTLEKVAKHVLRQALRDELAADADQTSALAKPPVQGEA